MSKLIWTDPKQVSFLWRYFAGSWGNNYADPANNMASSHSADFVPMFANGAGHITLHETRLQAAYVGNRYGRSGSAVSAPSIDRAYTLVATDIKPTRRPTSYDERYNYNAPVESPDVAVTPVIMHQLDDGSYTQLNPEVIKSFGEPIQFTPAKRFNVRSDELVAFGTAEGRCELVKLLGSRVVADEIGSVSFFSRQAYLDAFQDQAPDKLTVIRFKHMYKGGAGLPDFAMVTQTKKQVLSGSRMFLYKTKLETVNWDTCKIEEIDFVALGMCFPLEKVRKYKKARRFFSDFVSELHSEQVLKYLDQEGYAKWISKLSGRYRTLWAGLDSFIEAESFKNTTDEPINKFDSINTMMDNDFPQMDNISRVFNSTSARKRRRAEKSFLEKRERQQKLTHEVAQYERIVEKLKNDIKAAEEAVARFQEQAAEKSKMLSTKSNTISSERDELVQLTALVPNLEAVFAKREKAYRREVKKMLVSPPKNSNFFELTRKLGVHITDVIYYTGTGRYGNLTEVSLRQNPDIAFNDKAKLLRIHMYTDAPSMIAVDKFEKGDDAAIVVAGPYEILVEQLPFMDPKIRLKVSREDAIIGVKPGSGHVREVFLHPHAKPFNVSVQLDQYKQQIFSEAETCLGEAAATLHHAFKNGDPRAIVLGTMAWIESANSADEWGRNWVFFPPVENTFLQVAEPEPEPEIEIISNETMQEYTQALEDGEVKLELSQEELEALKSMSVAAAVVARAEGAAANLQDQTQTPSTGYVSTTGRVADSRS